MSATGTLTKLHGWLTSVGYPFELRVGAVLRKAGWMVEHATYFIDPETKKTRELDLLVSLRERDDLGRSVASISLALECKSSQEKPWVVFTAPERYRGTMIQGNPLLFDELSRLCEVILLQEKRKSVGFVSYEGIPVAHGITKAFADGKSTGDPSSPFAALRSAMTAAQVIGEKALWVAVRTGVIAPRAEIVLPIVVLDGKLFQFAVDEDGEETLAEIGHCAVTVPTNDATFQAVQVMTFDGFKAFAEGRTALAGELIQDLLRIAPDAAAAIVEYERDAGQGGDEDR